MINTMFSHFMEVQWLEELDFLPIWWEIKFLTVDIGYCGCSKDGNKLEVIFLWFIQTDEFTVYIVI